MEQTVPLRTIQIVARPQSELKLPTGGIGGVSRSPTFLSREDALRQAPWLIAPPSLEGGFDLKQTIDSSDVKPGGGTFSDFRLIYGDEDGRAILTRETLVRDYVQGPNLLPQVTVYGALKPFEVSSSPAAMLTIDEAVISETARIPAIMRIYIERDGVLVEVEGPPRGSTVLLQVAEGLVAT